MPGTTYRRQIQPDLLSATSPYYEALLRHKLTFCYYCEEFHPTALCLPPEFSPAVADLVFSCLHQKTTVLYPCHDLVMFVRLCGFLLLPESFICSYLVPPVHSFPLYGAPLPLVWECYRNGYLSFTSYLCKFVYGSFVPWEVLQYAKSFRSFIRHFHNYRRTRNYRRMREAQRFQSVTL